MRALSLILAFLTPSNAFVVPATTSLTGGAPRPSTSLEVGESRADFLRDSARIAGAAILSIVTDFSSGLTVNAAENDVSTSPSGVTVKIVKSGDGPAPDVGELAAIRFASYFGENKIDDIFDTPEPYYTRIGSGGLIKGVEEVLPKMRVGDRWLLTIPGNLAFGPKGRPASAGKPRIPGNAEITFEVEMVGLPGKEPELIELIGDV